MVCVPHALQVLEGQTPLPLPGMTTLRTSTKAFQTPPGLLAEDHAHRQGHRPGHRAVRGGVFRRDVSEPESML